MSPTRSRACHRLAGGSDRARRVGFGRLLVCERANAIHQKRHDRRGHPSSAPARESPRDPEAKRYGLGIDAREIREPSDTGGYAVATCDLRAPQEFVQWPRRSTGPR
jgi:hypothetical protein